MYGNTAKSIGPNQGCMKDASDTRIQVNLILVELFGKYVPVHYLGVVSLGLDWQLNKDVSFSELVPNLASVPKKIYRLFTVLHL
jgi:hypothetical protein